MHTYPRRPRRTLARTVRRTWRRLRYRRIPYWTVVGIAVVVAAISWNATVHSAEQALAVWGTTTRVPVATARVEPGETVTGSVVDWREMPLGVVAGQPSLEPTGRIATDLILAGEVVAEERLAEPGASGTSSLVPTGARGIAVPVDDTLPPVEVGDRVELLAGTGAGTDAGAVAHTATTTGVVVAVSEDTITVAVRAADAGPVAAAVSLGAVSLALLP